jgi:hypothetical protein
MRTRRIGSLVAIAVLLAGVGMVSAGVIRQDIEFEGRPVVLLIPENYDKGRSRGNIAGMRREYRKFRKYFGDSTSGTQPLRIPLCPPCASSTAAFARGGLLRPQCAAGTRRSGA